MVRLAPLYEDTLYANGEIEINARDEFTSASVDPFRNSIKATGDVYLPDVRSGRTRFMTVEDDGLDGKGVLQANGKVYSRTPAGDEARHR